MDRRYISEYLRGLKENTVIQKRTELYNNIVKIEEILKNTNEQDPDFEYKMKGVAQFMKELTDTIESAVALTELSREDIKRTYEEIYEEEAVEILQTMKKRKM